MERKTIEARSRFWRKAAQHYMFAAADMYYNEEELEQVNAVFDFGKRAKRIFRFYWNQL